MILQDLLEAKKSHDACSDEIDTYHAASMDALKELKKSIGDGAEAKHLKDAMSALGKAMSLATNWNRRCG
jgi:hypothetical protein